MLYSPEGTETYVATSAITTEDFSIRRKSNEPLQLTAEIRLAMICRAFVDYDGISTRERLIAEIYYWSMSDSEGILQKSLTQYCNDLRIEKRNTAVKCRNELTSSGYVEVCTESRTKAVRNSYTEDQITEAVNLYRSGASNGNHQLPNKSNQRLPIDSNHQLPIGSKGNPQLPSKGNQQLPTNGNQQLPTLVNGEHKPCAKPDSSTCARDARAEYNINNNIYNTYTQSLIEDPFSRAQAPARPRGEQIALANSCHFWIDEKETLMITDSGREYWRGQGFDDAAIDLLMISADGGITETHIRTNPIKLHKRASGYFANAMRTKRDKAENYQKACERNKKEDPKKNKNRRLYEKAQKMIREQS